MPSPSPTPRALKLLEGARPGRDSGGRRVGKAPGYVRLPPIAPDWLPDEARRMWELTVVELQRVQITKPIDEAGFTAFVLSYDRLVTASKLIQTEGLFHENSQGRVKHPAVAVAESASREMRGWCQEFGLTPSAEQRVMTPDVDDAGDDDPYN